MALATGWERATLRRQPASFVRALIWRLYAARRWDPQRAEAARTTIPLSADPAFAKARTTQVLLIREQQAAERTLWPEDGDG